MTGAFVRIKRGDKWISAELETLTDEELEQWIEAARSGGANDGWPWVRTLVCWIRDNVRQVKKEKSEP